MMQSFFNGLSGLLTFSKGLNNVSNNVSNMNTPGFRGSDTFYRTVSGGGEQGLGAGIAETAMRNEQGEIRQSGGETDVAINGMGFFVLQGGNGTLYYSRAGQFQFNKDNVLVDTVTQYKVAGLDATGALTDISINNARTLPPVATTKIEFVGNLVVGSSTHAISSVQVYDATGATQTLTVNFTKNTTGWQVVVNNAAGTQVGTGEIRFGADGSPLADFNTFNIALTSNGQSQTIALDFGTPGGFNKATQFSGANSTLGARVTDGSAMAGLTSLSFDDKGMLKFVYSNGEKRDGAQLALAGFTDVNALRFVKGSLYQAPNSTRPEFGKAGSGAFGQIKGGYVELSNIDLAQEFGDLLIIQRGYQASSRVMTVANEMVEQLYSNRGS